MHQTIILKVEGMSCGHCKMSVEKALQAIPGVESATVDLGKKEVVVTGSADRESLIKAIEAIDFEVVQ